MKANELMIGDWIFYGKTPVRVLQLSEGKVYKGFYPIPLTAKILEKNGFKSWEHGYAWKERIGMGGQTTSASSPIEVVIYEGGHSVIMNPHEGKEFQGSIDNVHELQHALRLCGINKEIVI